MSTYTNPMRSHSDLNDQWNAGNDAGRGYSVGEDGDTPEQAAEREGWTVEHERAADDDICVARTPDGLLVGIGDANGAWAVDLDEDEE